MKVISLLQPWATLVVFGAKKIETRSWNTRYRGPILIHASKKLTQKQIILGQEFNKKFGAGLGFVDDLPTGAIIGKVDIISTETSFMINEILTRKQDNWRLHPNREFMNKFFKLDVNHEQELTYGDYSQNRYGWLLSDPVQFAQPIPVKGARSLWNFDMPDHFHIPIAGGGHATFPLPPDNKTLEAVNKMVELAKKLK